MLSINLLKRILVCSKCGQEFDAGGVYRKRIASAEFRASCNECNHQRERARKNTPEQRTRKNKRRSEAYYSDPELRRKKLESGKSWREGHPDLKGYMSAAAKRHYERNINRKRKEQREKYWRDPEKGRRQSLQRNYAIYGLTDDDFAALVKKQNGVCAICSRPERRKIRGRVTRLSVDHCHKTGKIRGLLCSHCNSKLSLFEELVDHLGIDLVIERLRKYLGV